jgi:cation:H+ antiporter
LIAYALLLDGTLDRIDGILLFAGTFALLGWMLWLTRQAQASDPMQQEIEEELSHRMSTPRALLWTVFSLALLIASSRLLVWGAVAVAHTLGVSDLVIGLTIIAIGTSLPELAVSITAALKGEHDMVIGNIIGSNMFNLLAVLGIAGMIRTAHLSTTVLQRDFPVMLLLTFALYLMARGRHGGSGEINRIEAGLLLAAYAGYLAWLYVSEINPAPAA